MVLFGVTEVQSPATAHNKGLKGSGAASAAMIYALAVYLIPEKAKAIVAVW
jgi:hypothetical protein